jgi:hypothetical protein
MQDRRRRSVLAIGGSLGPNRLDSFAIFVIPIMNFISLSFFLLPDRFPSFPVPASIV